MNNLGLRLRMAMSVTNKDIIQAIITNPKLNEDEKSLLVEKLISEIKKEYPNLQYHATKQDVTKTELRLTKEIEATKKEIEATKKEIKELDVKLSKEIKEAKLSMIKWSFVFWVSQMSALFGIGFFILKGLNLK